MTDRLGRRRGTDEPTLKRLFGTSDVLPLWIAEPTLPLAPAVVEALQARADEGCYGYELRKRDLRTAFWEWNAGRHGWDGEGVASTFSPSIGTTLAVLIDLFTDEGDGVILQPPVFTDFKPLVRRSRREPVTNALALDDGAYRMDLDNLEVCAADPATKFLILCNPHNPVGRVWTASELRTVGEICARNDVFVFSDEVHGDVILDGHSFVPFGSIDHDPSLRWAAGTSPIKSFGLAGIADTFLLSNDDDIIADFRRVSDRLHLVRNGVFGLAASIAAYQQGAAWLDGMIETITARYAYLRDNLPDPLRLVEPEGSYLAWLDLRGLGLDVPELATWLANEARLALSPGHWFGRQGAGFARMTVAVEDEVIEEAVSRLKTAVARM